MDNTRGHIKYLWVDFNEAVEDYVAAITTTDPNHAVAFYDKFTIVEAKWVTKLSGCWVVLSYCYIDTIRDSNIMHVCTSFFVNGYESHYNLCIV